LNITFALKEFFANKKENEHLTKHFLLAQARLKGTLTFSDSSKKVFTPARGADGKFVLVLDAAAIPAAGGAGHKKVLTRLLVDFVVDQTIGTKTFQLLRIIQEFSLTALPVNSDLNIAYRLSPFSWTHSKTGKIRRANANVHPLLDLSKLSQDLVMMNALIVDLTELWDHLHKKNKHYKRYKDLTMPDKVTFKVFAHLGGSAFIWYSVVPSYLSTRETIAPHVFYSPSDWSEQQNKADDKKYLFDNAKQFEAQDGSDDFFDGTTLLMRYLLPPVDDDRISTLNPKIFTKTALTKFVKRTRRNVAYFGETGDAPPKPEFETDHWEIGAGLERAFYGLGKFKPQQFLLMPQVFARSFTSSSENGAHLKKVTDTIVDLLQSNTDHLPNSGKDELVTKDKMVLSCYSESSVDLWRASNIHIDHIKAIIGIEPNHVNPTGAGVIPKLLNKKILVFIIGRHVGFNDHYRPKISKDLQDKIHFLPDDPLKILKYPPDPNSNDFVKHRVARVTDKNLDPLMREAEKDILDDLAKRKPPATGKAAIPVIFTKLGNSDDLKDAKLTSIFYTHNYALTGGQEMTLADPVHFYGKPVKYRTFFQQAVDMIG
jgi:hypothetical protein